MVPYLYYATNAQEHFKKADIKGKVKQRREDLDDKHGVDRSKMKDDFTKLDEMYRVSEKEEIEKYKRIGKTTKQFYEDKLMREELETQKAEEKSDDKMMKMKEILREGKQGDIKVKETQGDGYSTIEIDHKSDSPDPRVGGTKITFDSRLDNQNKGEISELGAFLKVKADMKQRR